MHPAGAGEQCPGAGSIRALGSADGKETGTVLFAKDEHAKLEPASVTKVMTLLLTMEAIDAGQLHYDDVVTASAHACSMGGSRSG